MSIFKFTSLFLPKAVVYINPLINIKVSKNHVNVNVKSIRNFSIKSPEKKNHWKSQNDFEKHIKNLKSTHNFGTLDNIQDYPKFKQFVKILQEECNNCDTNNMYLTGEQVYDILGRFNMLIFIASIPKESRILPKSQGITRGGRNDIYCYEYNGNRFHVSCTDYAEIFNPSYLITFLLQDIKMLEHIKNKIQTNK